VVLGCGCGVELVVCVSVVRVGVCLRGCLWRFGGVVAGVLGKCGACGVCSRLLEMADVRLPLQAGGTKTLRFPSRSGGNLKEGGNCKL
jgi:hypothetical protein